MPNLIDNRIYYETEEITGLVGYGPEWLRVNLRRAGLKADRKIKGRNYYDVETVRTLLRATAERRTKKKGNNCNI